MSDDPFLYVFTIYGSVMIGMAFWALGIGDVGSALLSGTVGLLFFGFGIINLVGRSRHKHKRPYDDVVKTDDPEGFGRRIGVETAKRLHKKRIEEAEIKKREKKATIDTPIGTLYIDLTFNQSRRQWVVAVPVGAGSWDYYNFDNYDDALKFYEGAKKGIEEFFRGDDGNEGNEGYN